MSFSRVNYDQCAYKLKMNQSTQPGDYRLLDKSVENENACISYGGPIGSKADVSVAKLGDQLEFDNMVDIESKLSWRYQLLNKCNENNFLVDTKVKHKKKCASQLITEDTRFTHPIDDYRCMNTIDYNYIPYLFVNPQDYYQEDRIGTNSRLFVKDTFITPPTVMWDKGGALPPNTITPNASLLPQINSINGSDYADINTTTKAPTNVVLSYISGSTPTPTVNNTLNGQFWNNWQNDLNVIS
jgi:hypothetical protein